MDNNKKGNSEIPMQPDMENRKEIGQTSTNEANAASGEQAAAETGAPVQQEPIPAVEVPGSGGEVSVEAVKVGKPPKKGSLSSGKAAFLTFLLIMVLIGAVSVALHSIRTGNMKVTVEAVYTAPDSKAVAPDTPFRIRFQEQEEVTVEELYGMISLEPDLSFSLTQEVDGSFLLRPRKVLEVNSSIAITVGGTTSRFTVADMLVVTSHFPAADSSRVLPGTGIELKFNKEVELDALMEAFTIFPIVSMDIEQGEGKYVLYPVSPMDYNTEYQVTLSGELQAADGAPLARQLEFSFRTATKKEKEVNDTFRFSLSKAASNFLTTETPLLGVYLDNRYADIDSDIQVEVYQVDTWWEYYDLLWDNTHKTGRSLEEAMVNTEAYHLYAEFSIEPLPSDEEYDTRLMLEFPEELPEGWYVVQLTVPYKGTDVGCQAFVQVSDLSVYTMTMGSNILAWVNDTATGEGVADAEIAVDGAYVARGVTDADGMAHIEDGVFEEDADSAAVLFTVADGERVFVGINSIYSGYYEGDNAKSRYVSYLFTDRPIYMTTDTIQVWGVLRPRSTDIPQPTEARIVMGYENTVEQVIQINSDGTFQASIEYENITTSYWSINLQTIEKESLQYSYLEITDYVKPIYTGSTWTDKPVYMVGHDDVIQLTAEFSMFDGTPASQFGAALSAYDFASAQGKELVTDAEGRLHTTLTYTGGSKNSWSPRSYSYWLNSTDPQAENFSISSSFYLIHRDIMLQSRSIREDGNQETMRLEVTTNHIDSSGIQTRSDMWAKDALKGAPVSRPVTATLYHSYYEKQKTGTRYDYITRTARPTYTYTRHTDPVRSETFETTGGSYILDDLPISGKGSSYHVVLSTTDSQDRNIETKIYLGQTYSYRSYDDRGYDRYSFDKVVDPSTVEAYEADSDYDYYDDYYYYYYDYRTYFGHREDVTFEVLRNDEPVESLEGRILYTVVQDDFSYMGTTSGTTFDMKFNESLVPNYVLMGVYFDGKRLHIMDDMYMYFDKDTRKLEVQLDPDKDVYGPGGEINVTATVTDANTGEAAEGAVVLLSVVDEAIFALREQTPAILSKLYASVYYPYVNKYISSTEPSPPAAGEKGGGGGDDMAIRSDFEDTAYFSTATAEDGGKARFRFKLPDNITSWRLTSLALTGDNFAGEARTTIRATMDYYVMPIVNEQLLTGDSLSVGLYSAGVGVADDDEVNYTVTLTGNGVQKELSQTSTVRGYASVDFGEVESGTYTVQIRGVSGGYGDGVELPVTVVDSGIEVPTVDSFLLSEGIDVSPLRYPVNISFYSPASRSFQQIQRSLYYPRAQMRVDSRIARAAVAQIQKEQGVAWYDTDALEERLDDFSSYSLLSVLPYADKDLEFTVKAYLAAPDIVGSQRLQGVAYNYYGDVEQWSDAVVCLAEAVTGQDFTKEPQTLLDSRAKTDYVDQIYIAMAFAASGNEAKAGELYKTLVSDNLQEITAVSGHKIYYVDPKGSQRSREDCTAAASMLATMLGNDDARYLVEYLVEKPSKYEWYILEKLYYLSNNVSGIGDSTAQMSYVRDGETVTLDLDYTHMAAFNRQQLAEADFQVISGDVYADVYYIGTPDIKEAGQNLIGVTKTIEAVDGAFEPGAKVKITIKLDYSQVDTSLDSYSRRYITVEDYIPSGMRFVSGNYVGKRQGQRVQLSIDPQRRSEVVYYARCSTPGDYIVESAYANSNGGAGWGASERSTVTIQP